MAENIGFPTTVARLTRDDFVVGSLLMVVAGAVIEAGPVPGGEGNRMISSVAFELAASATLLNMLWL